MYFASARTNPRAGCVRWVGIQRVTPVASSAASAAAAAPVRYWLLAGTVSSESRSPGKQESQDKKEGQDQIRHKVTSMAAADNPLAGGTPARWNKWDRAPSAAAPPAPHG